MPRWKRLTNNAAVIAALVALLLGYSVFVVLPLMVMVLWLLRRGHSPVTRSTPRSGFGRLLDSRVAQAVGLVAVVVATAVQVGVMYAIGVTALLLACWLFAERFFPHAQPSAP
jgi:membrane protein implicated in regulation of membrane protease activity